MREVLCDPVSRLALTAIGPIVQTQPGPYTPVSCVAGGRADLRDLLSQPRKPPAACHLARPRAQLQHSHPRPRVGATLSQSHPIRPGSRGSSPVYLGDPGTPDFHPPSTVL